MTRLLSLCSLLGLLAVPASASRAVMESIPATNFTARITTGAARVEIGAPYTGGVSSTSLYVASNTVVGNCVIYSTGGITCLGIVIGGGSGPAGPASTVTVAFAYDNFLNLVDGSTKAFVLTGTPISTTSIFMVMDGLLQAYTSDYIYVAATGKIYFTTAPAANSSSLYAQYAIYTSTLPGVVFLASTQTISGSNKFTSTTTMVMNEFFFVDQQTANTNAAAHSTTYAIRNLNTQIYNVEGVCTISANAVTCPAGTYHCVACDCFQNTGSARTILWDVTNALTLGRSNTAYANTATESLYFCAEARFTKTASFAMAVHARAAGATACSADNYAEVEQYATLWCRREN